MVGIMLVDSHIKCGGMILSASKILTAYHCVKDESKTYQVCVGSDKLDMRQCFAISSITHHYSFTKTKIDPHDLAIITLVKPLSSATHCQIRMINDEEHERMRNSIRVPEYTALGFGVTEFGYEEKRMLQETTHLYTYRYNTEYPFYSSKYCSTFICATGGSQDTCKGDSGGPLIWQDTSSNTSNSLVVGMTIGGFPSGDKDAPHCIDKPSTGIYIDLHTHRKFLLNHIDDSGESLPYCPDGKEERARFWLQMKKMYNVENTLRVEITIVLCSLLCLFTFITLFVVLMVVGRNFIK